MKRRRIAVVVAVAAGAATAWLITAPSEPARRASVDGTLVAAATRAEQAATPTGEPTDVAAQARGRAQRLRVRGPIATDPTLRDYDPSKLVQAGQRPWEIFELEPRDARWADPMEQRIQERAQRDLDAVDANVRVTAVECRQSTCTMTAESPEPFTAQSMFILQVLGVAPIGMVRFTEHEGSHIFEQCVVFDPDTRELDDNLSWYAEKRQRVLARNADGGAFPLPSE